MAIWNSKTPTTADVAAITTTTNAASVAAAAAVPADIRPSTSGNYATLTMRPWGSASGTYTAVKDTWRCTLTHMRAPWTVSGLAVVTTTAAAGGTAALLFGIWARDATTGRPGARLANWTTLGTIDLTTAPATLVLATPGLVLPAGEYFLGCAWTGTATTSPVLVSHAGLASGTDSSTSNNTGYTYTSSAATVPDPFVAAAATTQGPMILARLV